MVGPIALTLAVLLSSAQAQQAQPAAHTVVHVSEAPTRSVPSGKASVMRIAGKQEGAQSAFFAVLELVPGAKVPLHRDATEEYIYIVAGTGKITIDGTVHELRPGSGVFMPAGAEVSFVVTGQETLRAVQVFAGQGPEAKYDAWPPKAAQ
jgi:quercetin dioxygenase-like cupin family protein